MKPSPRGERDTSPKASRNASAGAVRRLCAWNPEHEIPVDARSDAKFCSTRCRQASHRFAVEGAGAVALGRAAIRIGYADPPYPGKAHLYPEGREVDHVALVMRLVHDFPDGWALSTSSDAFPWVVRLCPIDVRVGIWVRQARHVKSRRAINGWEPVIFHRGRPLATGVAQDLSDVCYAEPADLVIARGRYRAFPGAITGMKPPAFSEWLFRQLGARAGDAFADLFPGSGAVSLAWDRFTRSADPGDGSGDASRVDRETRRAGPADASKEYSSDASAPRRAVAVASPPPSSAPRKRRRDSAT